MLGQKSGMKLKNLTVNYWRYLKAACKQRGINSSIWFDSKNEHSI